MRVDTIFPQCNAQRKWKHNSHLDKFKEMWMVVKQRRSQNSWKREFFLLFDKVSKLNIWDFIHYYSSKQLFDALTCSGGIVSCAESDVTLPLCTLFDLSGWLHVHVSESLSVLPASVFNIVQLNSALEYVSEEIDYAVTEIWFIFDQHCPVWWALFWNKTKKRCLSSDKESCFKVRQDTKI